MKSKAHTGWKQWAWPVQRKPVSVHPVWLAVLDELEPGPLVPVVRGAGCIAVPEGPVAPGVVGSDFELGW